MIEDEIIEPKIIQTKKNAYFMHYFAEKENINKQTEELKENNIELHKKLIKEGHNPNEIPKIIRKDEVEKLQEISSQTNFDFNQTIAPSLYERCSFINKKNVTLIDYAAFFSAIKCFKYLLMNGSKVENAGKYAVAGGNEEIIHLCEQNHSTFDKAYETAIELHRNDIFRYLYENKLEKINKLEELGKKCVLHDNYNILSFLEKEGMQSDKLILIKSINNGKLFIFQYFLDKKSKPIKFSEISTFSGNKELFNYLIKHKYIDIKQNENGQTALMKASWNGHTEIVKLLLEQEGIDINAKDKYWQTALMYASWNGHTEIVKFLLEQEGIDINAKDKYGKTALIWASLNDHTEIVGLIKKKLEINNFYKVPFK